MKIILQIILYITLFGINEGTDSRDGYVSQLLKSSNEFRASNRAKSLSYLQEALNYEDKIADTTLLDLYHTAGTIFKDQELYYIALNYFYKCLELQEKINPSESFLIFNNIGGCYFYLNNYVKAREFWGKSIKEFENYSKQYYDTSRKKEGSLIYNNLAVLEKTEGNNVKALNMLKEFKFNNEQLDDTLNIIMAYENIADIYINLCENDTAVDNLRRGIVLAEAIQSEYDLASLFVKLGNIYLEIQPNKDSALFYLQKSFELSNHHNFVDLKLSSSEKLVILFEQENNLEEALYYLHLAKSLSERAINEEIIKKVNQLELGFNEKIKQKERDIDQNKRENLFIIGIVLLLLFSTIISLMLKLQQSKAHKRTAENQLLAKQLEEKNKELTSNALQMLETSETLESTRHGLNKLKLNSSSRNEKTLSHIIANLKRGSQAFNKEEFENIFIKTEKDFYKKLLQKYPNLTKNEIRLCAFLKLNLASKEISAITKQSPHSIVVARSRLRKKLRIERSQSLTVFLNTL